MCGRQATGCTTATFCASPGRQLGRAVRQLSRCALAPRANGRTVLTMPEQLRFDVPLAAGVHRADFRARLAEAA
jgi:hypothetical protein